MMMTMIRQTAYSYAGQLWWEVVDVDTGAVLFRSWQEAEARAYRDRRARVTRPRKGGA